MSDVYQIDDGRIQAKYGNLTDTFDSLMSAFRWLERKRKESIHFKETGCALGWREPLEAVRKVSPYDYQ